MEVPLQLQLSIALFTATVAATFVPPVRRAIPRPVEVFFWVAFVTVCVLGVATIRDPHARELNTSALWAGSQVINTSFGAMVAGIGSWISDHRFAIADWVVLIAGADIFALIFLGSLQAGRAWQPRVRLGEWMEIPIPAPGSALARQRQLAVDPLAQANRRLAAWSAVAATAALAKMVRIVRHAGWHVHAVINTLAPRVGCAARRRLEPIALRTVEIVNIQALLSAQSIDWYGPLAAGPIPSSGEHDSAESQRSDRLAS